MHDFLAVNTLDGSDTETINVTITGINDAAVISGALSGSVIEAGASNNGGTPTVMGVLTSADIDNQANLFQAITTLTSSDQNYGKLTITAAGVWSYTLSNDNAVVDALNDGDSLSDLFTVLTADGTAQVIQISITGATDGDPDDYDFLATGSSVSLLELSSMARPATTSSTATTAVKPYTRAPETITSRLAQVWIQFIAAQETT